MSLRYLLNRIHPENNKRPDIKVLRRYLDVSTTSNVPPHADLSK